MEVLLQDERIPMAISDAVFGCDFNESLIHQVVTAYRLGARQGSCAQKSRSEITGSNKKPWRQKGTGRARAGSVKSPIWRSGGVAFAAKSQNYSQKVNKKMYRGAMRSMFSELIRQDRLIIVKNFYIEKPKTKLLIQKLKYITLNASVLIITDDLDCNLFLAARNLYKIKVVNSTNIGPINLIMCENVILTVGAVRKIEESFV